MDVMRVDTGAGERRFCCCVAAYGYMGDLMAQSERMRSLGPSRYNLAGALTLFRNNVRCCPHPPPSEITPPPPSHCPPPAANI